MEKWFRLDTPAKEREKALAVESAVRKSPERASQPVTALPVTDSDWQSSHPRCCE